MAAAATVVIAAGLVARLAAVPGVVVERGWLAALVVLGTPIVWQMLAAARRGVFATDLVAAGAIVVAALLEQPLPGLVIVLMQSGGESLERFAEGRASAAVRDLEAAAPRRAHRVRDGALEDIGADDVGVGDLLLVRPGELIPCDGVVVSGTSAVDASSLTGEALPIVVTTGVRLMSGSTNGAGSFTLRATSLARTSQYARIVELVRTAQATKAPLQREAERYAVWFTPLTGLACAVTWLVSQDPLRVLAVLVVATPCPLILAPPVAIVGGISRAARQQIIVRTGAALERLAAVTAVVFDKTGTLSVGAPALDQVAVRDGATEAAVLRLAGALEQASSHPLARVVAEAAAAGDPALPIATEVAETSGRGVTGVVEGRRVHVGSRGYVAAAAPADRAAMDAARDVDAGLRSFVALDGRFAAVLHFSDLLRADAGELLLRLRAMGIRRALLLSGDNTATTRAVAGRLGIREVHGDLLPEDKVAIVQQLSREGETVLMVGDGTNDAPALSAADVGIALAGHGGGITSEAADVILLADRLARVGDAVVIGRRTMRVARQSIRVGLALSAIAIVFAAAGRIAPVTGAILQEAIDVAVILNALRASR